MAAVLLYNRFFLPTQFITSFSYVPFTTLTKRISNWIGSSSGLGMPAAYRPGIPKPEEEPLDLCLLFYYDNSVIHRIPKIIMYFSAIRM